MSVIFNCCRQCQVFFNCQTKWYRSEKNEENFCCEDCANFRVCEKISEKIQNLAGERGN